LTHRIHYYVWYHVASDVPAIRVAVAEMMADVAGRTGIAGRLLVRRDEPATWMETYEDVVDAATFERELAAAVLRHDLARLVAGGDRHVEAFVAAR
jgi:Domain of unknown function (DUF4936)